MSAAMTLEDLTHAFQHMNAQHMSDKVWFDNMIEVVADHAQHIERNAQRSQMLRDLELNRSRDADALKAEIVAMKLELEAVKTELQENDEKVKTRIVEEHARTQELYNTQVEMFKGMDVSLRTDVTKEIQDMKSANNAAAAAIGGQSPAPVGLNDVKGRLLSAEQTLYGNTGETKEMKGQIEKMMHNARALEEAIKRMDVATETRLNGLEFMLRDVAHKQNAAGPVTSSGAPPAFPLTQPGAREALGAQAAPAAAAPFLQPPPSLPCFGGPTAPAPHVQPQPQPQLFIY